MLISRFIIFLTLMISITQMGYAQQKSVTNSELSISEITKKINDLGQACWNLRLTHSDSAANLGHQAISLAEKYDILEPIPRISNYLGVVYMHCLHKEKESIPYFHQALEFGIQNKDSTSISYAYNNLGDAYLLIGNVPLSKHYSLISLDIFERLQSPLGIAYGYVNMGLVDRIDKAYSSSLVYFKKAIEIRKAAGDKTGIASVTYEIGKNYFEQGKLDSAMHYYQESLRMHNEINNQIYAAHCLNGIGNIYYQKNEFDNAYLTLQKAVELNSIMNHNFGLIDNYIGLALVCAQQKKVEEGKMALKKALEVAKIVDLSTKTLSTHKAFSTFYTILGEYDEANKQLLRFVNLYDSVLAVQQVETLEELQSNFTIRQNLNKTEDELISKKRERKNLIIIIILILSLTVLIVIRLRLKQKLNKHLNAINKTKDKLFSVISHDLKSPFNSLLGFSNLQVEEFEQENFTNAKKYAGIIHRKSEESLKLLNNLLTWSQSQTGRITYNPLKQPISLLASDLKDFFEVDAIKNDVQFTINNSLSKSIIYDIDILRIVLGNLISNSFKYTHPGGHIHIEIEQQDSDVNIAIRDTGIGIDENMLNKLFKSNVSIQSIEGIRQEKGTGLGLLITAELIRIHGGKISAKSEVGKGSLFQISFPLIS